LFFNILILVFRSLDQLKQISLFGILHHYEKVWSLKETTFVPDHISVHCYLHIFHLLQCLHLHLNVCWIEIDSLKDAFFFGLFVSHQENDSVAAAAKLFDYSVRVQLDLTRCLNREHTLFDLLDLSMCHLNFNWNSVCLWFEVLLDGVFDQPEWFFV
jgi:hypothetical protein